MPYKHFEHQLLHSLDPEDSRIRISRLLVAEILEKLFEDGPNEYVNIKL